MPDATAASDAVPPDDGWRLTEAMTDHLCGLEYLIFERKGPMLERELRKFAGARYNSASPPREAGRWLRSCLFKELRERTDLELTGHDHTKGVSAPRTRIPNSILRTAIQTEGDRPLQQGLAIAIRPGDIIDFYTDLSGSDVSSEQPRVLHERLTGVRVERVRADSEPTVHDAGTSLIATVPNVQRAVDKQELATWFRARVKTWPRGTPPPTGDACLAAAIAHFEQFGKKVPRDPFRDVRKDIVPETWRKPGPRS